LFRDFLRSHPDRAAVYAALKYDLAAKFSTPERPGSPCPRRRRS
jgi:GrpB-like predicted nucleotidyltransferase (UPF0157 family)